MQLSSQEPMASQHLYTHPNFPVSAVQTRLQILHSLISPPPNVSVQFEKVLISACMQGSNWGHFGVYTHSG